jgi:L-seryl-tRNA(Ser) seleniumtransferase
MEPIIGIKALSPSYALPNLLISDVIGPQMNQEPPYRRRPPSIDSLLRETDSYPIPRLLRKRLLQDLIRRWQEEDALPDAPQMQAAVHSHLKSIEKKQLQPVINATGVVLHTNLGRAPFSMELCNQITQSLVGYNNLELDLNSGKRGKRGVHIEKALAVLSGSESATVVNNCAAALILILNACKTAIRSEVLVSRSELVQIGGGFRIPEILESAGVHLKEIGTTNRTELNDYKKSITDKTALILKVHQSNFYMDGFVESASIKELAGLAKKQQIPFAVDLGSGALIHTESYFGIEEEPSPESMIKQGVDMVCFSGDKLMAGPQAGVIAGRDTWIGRLKSNPFFRALRPDKMALSALEFTVSKHLESKDDPESPKLPDLPAYYLLSQSKQALQQRADALLKTTRCSVAKLTIINTDSEIGGGTMPRTRMGSVAIVVNIPNVKADAIAKSFRDCHPPIMGYVHQGTFRLNLRTIFPYQDESIAACIHQVEEKLFTHSSIRS